MGVLASLGKTGYYQLRGKNILAHHGTIIRGIGRIEVQGRLVIGLSDVGFLNDRDRTYLNIRGKLMVTGQASLAKGCRLDIAGVCELGDVHINGGCKLVVMDRLTVGDGTVVSWDCEFLDEDFHSVDNQDSRAPISIGERVWIGNGCRILKGVTIGDGSVIGAGSLVVRSLPPRVLAVGNPARIVRENVSWGDQTPPARNPSSA